MCRVVQLMMRIRAAKRADLCAMPRQHHYRGARHDAAEQRRFGQHARSPCIDASWRARAAVRV